MPRDGEFEPVVGGGAEWPPEVVAVLHRQGGVRSVVDVEALDRARQGQGHGGRDWRVGVAVRDGILARSADAGPAEHGVLVPVSRRVCVIHPRAREPSPACEAPSPIRKLVVEPYRLAGKSPAPVRPVPVTVRAQRNVLEIGVHIGPDGREGEGEDAGNQPTDRHNTTHDRFAFCSSCESVCRIVARVGENDSGSEKNLHRGGGRTACRSASSFAKDPKLASGHVFWLTASNLLPGLPASQTPLRAEELKAVTSSGFVADYSGATASDSHGLPFARSPISFNKQRRSIGRAGGKSRLALAHYRPISAGCSA